MASPKSDKPLESALPGTMKALEKAWMSEVQTNKRERGNIYGAAGKKIDLSRPKTAPGSPGDTVPGLDNWLETANEHEKQVVYTFLDSVSKSMEDQKDLLTSINVPGNDTLQNSKKVRVSSAPAYIKRYSPAPSSRGSQRSSMSSQSSHSGPSVQRLNLDLPKNTDAIKRVKTALPVRTPPSPKNIDLSREKSLRRAKSAVSIRELESHELPQEPLSARSNGTVGSRQSCNHKHCHGYHESKCARCRDKLIKSLIKELESDDTSPYDQQFPGLQLPAHNRFYNTSAYYATEPDDYVHQHSLFTNAPKGNRGYFIIHPDWVSEFHQHRPSYR